MTSSFDQPHLRRKPKERILRRFTLSENDINWQNVKKNVWESRFSDCNYKHGVLRLLDGISESESSHFGTGSQKQDLKGWLPIAKLKPLVERYSCQPMRSLDTSNNLSVGPSCMWRSWNSWLCYLVSNAVERRAGWEKQGKRGRAGEEQWKGGGKLLNLVIQVTGVE